MSAGFRAASLPDRRVRAADPGDLQALARLWIGITRHHEALDPLFTLRRGAEAEIRSLLRDQLRDRDTAIFVFADRGELVGMCSVSVDRAPPILVEVERAEITDIGVAPEFRRRGIGRALAEAALAWIEERGVRRVEVRVAARNPEGQAFWRSLGFGDHVNILQRRAGSA